MTKNNPTSSVRYEAYTVLELHPGCPHCYRGKIFKVIGPDKTEGSTNHETLMDAAHEAAVLNEAFSKGYRAGVADVKRPHATAREESLLHSEKRG